MRHLLRVAFLFCLTSSIANAQVPERMFQAEVELNCAPAQIMLEFLAREFGQEQIWVGQDKLTKSPTTIAVMRNKETGSFTVVQYSAHVACVHSSCPTSSPAPDGVKK